MRSIIDYNTILCDRNKHYDSEYSHITTGYFNINYDKLYVIQS